MNEALKQQTTKLQHTLKVRNKLSSASVDANVAIIIVIIKAILTVTVFGVDGALKQKTTKLQHALIIRKLSSTGVDASIAIVIVVPNVNRVFIVHYHYS